MNIAKIVLSGLTALVVIGAFAIAKPAAAAPPQPSGMPTMSAGHSSMTNYWHRRHHRRHRRHAVIVKL